MKTIKRKSIKEDWVKEMLKNETHHNHKIILRNGVYRWKPNDTVNLLVDAMDLNKIIVELRKKGIHKHSEEYKKLYRDMGYSISGYYEVFYWEMNY